MPITCPKCRFDNPNDTAYCGKCATPLPIAKGPLASQTETIQTPIKELTTGSTFAGRYQVIEELGHGGMGKVYKVFDTKIKEKIALKLIRPEIASDRETIERFSNELRLARKIGQRNVCRMFDMGEAEGAHFITMEYVHGEDLKSMIHMSGSLSVGMLLSVGKQVCDGLAEAHSLGVVHRDLKPQNIMIDKNGNAKIMDFGIARSVREKGITGPSVMIGTPEYMSPEQAEAKEVDHGSDIYSLGVILYEMATSQVPFTGETALSIAMKHKGEIPKNPQRLNTNIPDDLSGVILKCLEKDKAKRYQSALDLRDELDRIEKGLPTAERFVPERKPITSRQITVQVSLKRLLIPVLVVFVLVAAAVVLWKVPRYRKEAPGPSENPSLAILYFENISGDPDLDDWKTGLTELLITDLAQSKFINVLSGDTIYGLLRKLDLLEAKKYASADLVKVADEGGVGYTANGSLMKAGDKIVITLMLLKPHKGEIVRPIQVECDSEGEILAKVDELSRVIKSELNLTAQQIAGDLDKEIGKITTSSPEAYKYFSNALKDLNRGDNKKAMELLHKAVAADPEFASAYANLSISYFNMGLRSKEREYIQKAFDLRDRVSEKERFEIEAYYYLLTETTYGKAIEAFNKLLELYPGYYAVRGDLGWTYWDIEDWDKAIEQYSIVVQKSKLESAVNYKMLSWSYGAKGLYDKAGEALEAAIKRYGDIGLIHDELARNYLCQGRYDLALEEADRYLTLDSSNYDGHLSKAIIYCCQGYLAEAQRETMEFLEAEPNRIDGHSVMGAIAISQGRYEKAREEIGRWLELAIGSGAIGSQTHAHNALAYTYLMTGKPIQAQEECWKSWESASKAESLKVLRSSLFIQGIVSIETGSLDKAQKTAAEIKKLIDKGMNKKAIRYYHNLLGRLELQRENYSKAIALFDKALMDVPFQSGWGSDHGGFIEPLATAYYRSGAFGKAAEEYEKLISHPVGGFGFGDIYAKSFYMLGRIAEQTGDTAKARGHYQKFLDLWKDADPGIPEVEDARKRLAGLKGS